MFPNRRDDIQSWVKSFDESLEDFITILIAILIAILATILLKNGARATGNLHEYL